MKHEDDSLICISCGLRLRILFRCAFAEPAVFLPFVQS